jgi:zinc protease
MPAAPAEPLVVTHGGRADQAFYGAFWQLPDYFADPKTSYAADVAAAILQTRLIDTVREKLGITYSPNVQAYTASDLPGYGYFAAILETPQANFETFRALLADQLHQVASQPVGADELQRAKKPLIEAATKDLENDGWWMGNLSQLLRDPRIKQAVLTRTTNIDAVSAADVQAVLTHFVTSKQPLTVIAKARP